MTEDLTLYLVFVMGATLSGFSLFAYATERLQILRLRKRLILPSQRPAPILKSSPSQSSFSQFNVVRAAPQHMRKTLQTMALYGKSRIILGSGIVALIGSFALFAWSFHSIFIAGVASVVLSFVLIFLAMRYFKSQRNAAIMRHLPQAIDGLIRCLSAGFDINRSLSIVAEEVGPELQSEFRYLLRNRDYGQTLGDAFHLMAGRLESRDIAFLATLISIQERSGGPMAQALESLSTILKDRERLRQKRMTASAEARMSALILGGLPVIVAMALFSFNSNYRDVLLGTQAGRIFLLIAFGLLLTGSLVMYRMIRIENRSQL